MKRILTFWKKGDSFILMTAGGLLFSIAMVLLMVGIILLKGLGFFWPADITEFRMQSGEKYLGQVWEHEEAHLTDKSGKTKIVAQTNIKIGNRDIYGHDFIWINNNNVVSKSDPANAVEFERWEYGNLYGFIKSFTPVTPGVKITDANFFEEADKALQKALENKRLIEKKQSELNKLITPLSQIQTEISLDEINKTKTADEIEKLRAREKEIKLNIAPKLKNLQNELLKLKEKNSAITVTIKTADGIERTIPFAKIIRFFRPNNMSFFAKAGFYVTKVWEFLTEDPRESNTEGGVFPAIFGTVLMVILMSIAVVPFGVLAALYLNEYAKQGPVIRLIRLAIANLAGVPSIVFGIFGLGFFVYILGSSIDQLFFSSSLPEPTFGTGGILWASLTLALLTLPVVVVATEEGILSVPKANKDGALALGSTKWQMIRKIVLPNAMPGILTGVILAISRGAGEVAPLMITGVVKLAPSLPIDGTFPFLHLERKFMHLGFHIYDVGFQSPNVEAALPMVYTTALLLILIVVALNLLAIYLRNNLKKKYKTSTF
jgi:phosphate transport system permease protein